MQVFALGGPQGNIGQKSVLVKKPVSRKFIELSSLEILFIAGFFLFMYIEVILADASDRHRENKLFVRLNYPERSWEKIAIDIFHYTRNDYLVIIDYYSRWIEIKQLISLKLTSDWVISLIKTVFTTHGIPD